MSNLGNKRVMSKNINRFLKLKGKGRKEASKEMGVSYSTFNDWASGNAYPRIDKIEMMANYFGVRKSDLVEDHEDEECEVQKMVNEVFANPDLKMLFSMSQKATKEEIQQVIDIFKVIKKKEE